MKLGDPFVFQRPDGSLYRQAPTRTELHYQEAVNRARFELEATNRAAEQAARKAAADNAERAEVIAARAAILAANPKIAETDLELASRRIVLDAKAVAVRDQIKAADAAFHAAEEARYRENVEKTRALHERAAAAGPLTYEVTLRDGTVVERPVRG